MFLILINSLPVFGVLAAIWLHTKERSGLSRPRAVLYATAIVANAVSAVTLVVFVIHAYIVSRGTTPADLDREYPVLTMLLLGVAAAFIASAGERKSRLLLLANGMATAVLWYIAGLAASP